MWSSARHDAGKARKGGVLGIAYLRDGPSQIGLTFASCVHTEFTPDDNPNIAMPHCLYDVHHRALSLGLRTLLCVSVTTIPSTVRHDSLVQPTKANCKSD